MQNLQWIEVRSELGAGKIGTSLGIDALKIAAINAGEFDFFSQFDAIEVEDENHHFLHLRNALPYSKRIEGISIMYDRISQVVCDTLKGGCFPVVLSGDHSNAGATIAGVRMAWPEKRLGVIWVDAHADLHSPYTSPSGNVHGMPLAASLGEDNLKFRSNVIPNETYNYWEYLKNVGNICPKIHYRDLVYIALRDSEKEEDHLIRENGVRVFRVDEVNNLGIIHTVRETLAWLSHCDLIYVSFDVDSMDAGLAWGTGTPVADGLSNLQARQLVGGLMADPKVCCFELAEINPLLDVENQMASLAFPVLKAAIHTLGHTRGLGHMYAQGDSATG